MGCGRTPPPVRNSTRRELIGGVVSAENGCGYCEMNHLRGLSQALKDPIRARDAHHATADMMDWPDAARTR